MTIVIKISMTVSYNVATKLSKILYEVIFISFITCFLFRYSGGDPFFQENGSLSISPEDLFLH